MKLFPILATIFAHTFTSDKIMGMYLKLSKDIETGDYTLMDLMHHLTSGGKSVHTQDCHDYML